MKAKFLALLLVAVTILTLFAGCAKDTPDPGTTDNNSDPSKNSITIGVSFATMQEEKWERCAENMQKKADGAWRKAGYPVCQRRRRAAIFSV